MARGRKPNSTKTGMKFVVYPLSNNSITRFSDTTVQTCDIRIFPNGYTSHHNDYFDIIFQRNLDTDDRKWYGGRIEKTFNCLSDVQMIEKFFKDLEKEEIGNLDMHFTPFIKFVEFLKKHGTQCTFDSRSDDELVPITDVLPMEYDRYMAKDRKGSCIVSVTAKNEESAIYLLKKKICEYMAGSNWCYNDCLAWLNNPVAELDTYCKKNINTQTIEEILELTEKTDEEKEEEII